MITTEHAQEGLSRSYIGAIAAMAGVNLNQGVFDYGIDGAFREVVARNQRLVESGFQVEFQLKSTKNWSFENDHVVYALRSKNYNDLVTRDEDACRAILILMCLPQGDAPPWLDASEHELILRHCCYWAVLSGDPVPNENSTKTIRIPRTNRFDAAQLSNLLSQERQRRLGEPL